MNQTKLKILYIDTPLEPPGGGQISLLTLLENINRDEYDIMVFVDRECSFKYIVEKSGINIKVVSLKKLFGEIKNFKPDIVHINSANSKYTFFSSFFSKILGIKVIWHNRVIESSPLRERIITTFVDRVIVISDAVGKKFEYFGEKVIKLYNPVDFNKIYNVEDKNIVKNKLNIKDMAKIAGVFSRLDLWKGHRLLFEAFSKIKRDDLYLIVCGEGNEKENLIRLAKDLKIGERVIFLGHIDNVYDYINICDVVINPSIEPEPFGRVIIESMALGKVVISTDMGGPREIIDNYNNGMLVSPSPDLLSNAILNALDDKSLYDRISSNAKIKAKDFDVKKYIEKIKSVYANLIGKYSKNIKISALLIVRNEEKKIERVLQSLKWCDEIVVVDQSSTDKTCEIASKYTDKIFITEPKGVCEPDRKFGISKAKFDWVIMMDADEILNKDNINEIKNMISLGLYDVLMMKRRNYFLGKWIKTCGWYPTFVPRIFKKGSVDFGDNIHNDGLVLSDRVYYLKNDVDHFSYDSIDDWIDKFKRYTSRHADEYYRNGIKLNTKNFIREVILRPVYFFLLDYIRFKGFKDGWRGFFISLSSSLTVMFSYFKLIEIYEKKK